MMHQKVVIGVAHYHEDLQHHHAISDEDGQPVFQIEGNHVGLTQKTGSIHGIRGTQHYVSFESESNQMVTNFSVLGSSVWNHPNRKIKYR